MRTRAGKAVLVMLLVLAGCPKRFDPRAETVRSSPDPEADQAYREARARLQAGENATALAEFAAFQKRYPNDPLVQSARLGEARAALGLGEAKKAQGLIEPMAGPPPANEDPLAAATRARARYVLGLALHRTGEWQRSRELLEPFVSLIAAGDDATELHAVLADDALHLGDTGAALDEYEIFFQGARPAERLYVRDRVSELVSKLSPGDALERWNRASKSGVVAAYLGPRVAADLERAGNQAQASEILSEAQGARAAIGFAEPKRAQSGGAAIRAIGCLLPLSGKGRALGQRALRGALLAAGLMPGSPGSIDLVVRDSGSDPTRAEQAVDELAQAGVAAIVGTPERLLSQAAAPRAEALGVPYLELSPDGTRRGELTFKLVRPRQAAAEALIRRAARSGARTVALLAPQSAYGQKMAEALGDAARAAGLRVVADLHFQDGATTFVDPARRIKAARPDALFVPAPAYELALIAPQLAASGVTAMPGVRQPGKTAQLYATADGIGDSFLSATAKYLQGAVLAPTFYPDSADPQATSFVERYREAYGDDPSALDALAFDAVRAARLAIDEAGSASRGQVAMKLAHLGEGGLTGELGFTASGDRAGLPPLFVVDGDQVHLLK